MSIFIVLGPETRTKVREWCEANGKPFMVHVVDLTPFGSRYYPGWQYYFHAMGVDCTQAIMMCVLAHRQVFLDADPSLSGGELIVDDIDRAVELYKLYAGRSNHGRLDSLKKDAYYAPGLNWCEI